LLSNATHSTNHGRWLPPVFCGGQTRELRKSTEKMRKEAGADTDEGEQIENSSNTMNRWGRIGTIATVGALIAGKSKWVIATLKLAKLPTVISMFATTAAYTWIFGFPFAAGLVGQIMFHESGHALVMKREGIPFSPMVFIPFVGAFVAMQEPPKNAYIMAKVAYGGPLFGALAAWGLAVVGLRTGSQLIIGLADFGFMLNLFNLLPLGTLDGGHILGSLSRYWLLLGLLFGIWFVMNFHTTPLMYLILLAGAWTTFQRFTNSSSNYPPSFYQITPQQRLVIGLGYILLVGLLLAGKTLTSQNMLSQRELRKRAHLEQDSTFSRLLDEKGETWDGDWQ
jgi:Zn-dependent protease